MAIGDSLYNGVQSLRINWWLSEWAPPSLVAIRLGLIEEKNSDRTGDRNFYGPQYYTQDAAPGATQSYGFNLENIPGLTGLLSAPRRQAEALKYLALQYQPPNGRQMVDNIAFSGANSSDMFAWKAGDYRRAAIDAIARAARGADFGALADAFLYANAYFVLNPTKNTCLDDLSALDQVELRQPKRLMINIGSNNGLYRLAFEAASLDDAACDTKFEDKITVTKRCNAATIREFITTRYLADLRQLFLRLSKIPRLETVYFNNLALPSQPANLVYDGKNYKSSLFGTRNVSPSELNNNDEFVHQVNNSVSSLIEQFNQRSGPNFVYVDQSGTLENFDYKKCVDEKSADRCNEFRLTISAKNVLGLTSGRDVKLDNRPFEPGGQSGYVTGASLSTKTSQGGLFSFDNMHLSTVGYELMAQTVLANMKDDPLYIPAFRDGRDTCPNRGEKGFGNAAEGACAALLTTPGWSYADATRREFNFLRLGGEDESKRKEFLRALLNFVSRFAN